MHLLDGLLYVLSSIPPCALIVLSKLMSLFFVFVSRVHCDRSVGVPLSK